MAGVDAADLGARLPSLMLRDEHRLRRRLERTSTDELPQVAAAIAEAEARIDRRRVSVPAVTLPPDLPISARADDLAAAIADHQVVVVAGETGSGKTTQLPKVCLQLGRGVRGAIGHTQPRRLAARTVAERIAEELRVPLGAAVGYEVRFAQRASPDTLVKVMTDGILLAAIQSDPLLQAYDSIIIDEAHERSLNIDFLLGYLARLLPRRPDLKLIITSATIDPHRFAAHFDHAPVIEVSGRTYPVEVRYRPRSGASSNDETDEDAPDTDDTERDQPQAICDAVEELVREGPGDVLVFLSGEREIRDAADALEQLRLRDTEVLPLYARLSPAQQHRVFTPHRGRRIVLATNVAETSLTVPGIRYVVDTGLARISRYSARLKVQRLPIEKISQASADQRKGRCGRLADGICVRLYDEDDFLARPRFTDPEILRTNLAAVLLQMASLGLGEIHDFPFLDPPDHRQVRDGLQLLHELGAIEPAGDADHGRRARSRRDRRRGADRPRLTPIGRTLARLPVDPRIGRMVVEADRGGCLDEVLVIAAALSIPDPRLRPTEQQQAADAAHARFAAADSDFLALVHLWQYLRTEQRARSSNQFRRLCQAEYLHYLRVREWQDLYGQLRKVARELGMRRTDTPAEPATIHRALLSGLLSHVGLRDGQKRDYRGARGARFAIWPGSHLYDDPPQWVVAAELVETSRLWGRTVARIDPRWAERLGAHLVTRTYSEPHWEVRRGGAVAYEKVSLYGVPLVTGRKVDLGRVDPAAARELFIRHALVDGEWRTSHEFWHANQRRLTDVGRLEEKARRRDVLVDDETLFAFYDERIGEEVRSARHFDSWWRDVRREQPDLLDLPRSLLVDATAAAVREDDYPDRWRQDDLVLRLSYRFDPGSASDGVTVHLPLTALGRLRPEGFEWLVPGLRVELVTELLRGLPKDLRRRLVPVPDTAQAVLAEVAPEDGPLLDVLGRALRRRGVVVPHEAWDTPGLPAHLRVTFRVEDADGTVIDTGRDLPALQQRLAPRVHAALGAAAEQLERRGMRDWELDTLPRTFRREAGEHTVRGYPALVDEGRTVGVRVFGSPAEQSRAMWAGTRRLLLLRAGSPVNEVHRRLDNATKLALTANPHGSVAALLDDALTCAADQVLAAHGGPVWDEASFEHLVRAVRAELPDALAEVLRSAAHVLGAAGEVTRRLQAATTPALAPSVADLRAQLAGLVHPGFLTAKTARRLPDVARYVEAMQRRLDVLARDPARDRQRMERIAAVQQAHRHLLDRLPPSARATPEVRQIPWLIEELRVSEFAQSLGTAGKVSPERILRLIDEVAA